MNQKSKISRASIHSKVTYFFYKIDKRRIQRCYLIINSLRYARKAAWFTVSYSSLCTSSVLKLTNFTNFALSESAVLKVGSFSNGVGNILWTACRNQNALKNIDLHEKCYESAFSALQADLCSSCPQNRAPFQGRRTGTVLCCEDT